MKLIFATHNSHKFEEVKEMFPKSVVLRCLEAIGCMEDIPETGHTISENAMLKARYVMETYGHACFADDTGLEVEALHGAPGVHTARYAGEGKDMEANIEKLLNELYEVKHRKAQFKTVIALMTPTETLCFEGIARGVITLEKRGAFGFGYDAIFMPDGHDKTFAELPLMVKNKISHRAKAIWKLIMHLTKTG